MRNAIVLICIIILVSILLLPVKFQLKDGGTVVYDAILYEVRNVHTVASDEDIENGKEFYEGTVVTILGFEIFNNVK